MPRLMKTIASASFALFAVFTTVNLLLNASWALSMAVTFGTIAYHFIMRLAVGGIIDRCMNNRADYTKRWYQPHSWEKRLYERIGVRRWKNKMPTYRPELFSPETRSWDEIAQAMCQSELVHETIVVLSFLPIAASAVFGSLPVFVITSLCAACIDLAFVVMQRYNRPLVVRLAQRQKRRKAEPSGQ